MSLYQFQPHVDIGASALPQAAMPDMFTSEELDKIVSLGESYQLTPATLTGTDASYRKSQVAWVGRSKDTEWLYEKMAMAAQIINAKIYQFDLFGFVEDLQYTVYDANEGGYFKWHVDQTPNFGPPRKLALSVQLSDPSDYEGGELQTMIDEVPRPAPLNRGAVIGIPAYTLHRVTPVTKGVRKSLVAWCSGPKFR